MDDVTHAFAFHLIFYLYNYHFFIYLLASLTLVTNWHQQSYLSSHHFSPSLLCCLFVSFHIYLLKCDQINVYHSAQPFDYQGFYQLSSLHLLQSQSFLLHSRHGYLLPHPPPPPPTPLPSKNTIEAKTVNSPSRCYLHWFWRLLCGGEDPPAPTSAADVIGKPPALAVEDL